MCWCSILAGQGYQSMFWGKRFKPFAMSQRCELDYSHSYVGKCRFIELHTLDKLEVQEFGAEFRAQAALRLRCHISLSKALPSQHVTTDIPYALVNVQHQVAPEKGYGTPQQPVVHPYGSRCSQMVINSCFLAQSEGQALSEEVCTWAETPILILLRVCEGQGLLELEVRYSS